MALRLFSVAGLAFIAFYLSDSAFLMIGGSDAGSFLVAPSASVQIICVIVFAILILAPAGRQASRIRMVCAIIPALIGTHRLVIDNNRGAVRDIYLLMAVQTLRLMPSADYGAVAIASSAGFRVVQTGNPASMWCLSPALIGLDREALLHAIGP